MQSLVGDCGCARRVRNFPAGFFNKTAATKVYAKQVEASVETINRASEIRLRAERRLGELLNEREMASAGRPKKIGSSSEPIFTCPDCRQTYIGNKHICKLAAAGISKKLSSRGRFVQDRIRRTISNYLQ